jgi:hypothetical protein
MTERIAILQPGYLPWLGFFDQMQQVDTFVIYDDVQYDKNGWRNRNKIKTPQGEQWLTVPVMVRGNNRPLIKDVLIDNHTDWRGKHLKSIKQNYSRAPFFKDYVDMLDRVYTEEWKWLLDLDITLVLAFREALGIKTKILYSSEMDVEDSGRDTGDNKETGNREHRLIDICNKLLATEFLEGNAGRGYLEGPNTELFNQSGIKIVYQEYQHPKYRQLYGEFQSHLSIVDLLMNCGPNSLKIIASGSKKETTVA